jgi:hypothetical protein
MAIGGPGSIADTLTKDNEGTFKEFIGTQTVDLLRTQMPLFSDIILDPAEEYMSRGDDGYGRNFKAIRTYYGSLTGTIASAGTKDFFNVSGDPTDTVGNRLYVNRRVQGFPDALSSAAPRAFRMATTLHSHLMNLPLSAAELRADANPANIRKFYEKKLQGLPRQLLLRVANEFFADPDGSLGTFATTDSEFIASNANRTLTFRPSNGAISRFEIGQEVDIYADSSGVDLDAHINSADGTTGARVEAWVEYVNPVSEVVRIVMHPTKTLGVDLENGMSGTYHVTIANHVNDAGTEAYKIYGWKDWLRPVDPDAAASADANKILGSKADTTDYVSVLSHPEFATPYFSSVGTLSRTKLMNIFTAIMRNNKKFGHDLDTAIVSHGVLEHMTEQITTLLRRDDGRPLGLDNYAPNPSNFVLPYGMNGANIDVYPDDCLEEGTMVCLKRKGNWRISTIPEGNAGKMASVPGAQMPAKLPIYSPLVGSNNLFRPIELSSGNYTQTTEHYDMPLYATFQIEPKDQIPGAVLSGISSSRDLGSTGPISL